MECVITVLLESPTSWCFPPLASMLNKPHQNICYRQINIAIYPTKNVYNITHNPWRRSDSNQLLPRTVDWRHTSDVILNSRKHPGSFLVQFVLPTDAGLIRGSGSPQKSFASFLLPLFSAQTWIQKNGQPILERPPSTPLSIFIATPGIFFLR